MAVLQLVRLMLDRVDATATLAILAMLGLLSIDHAHGLGGAGLLLDKRIAAAIGHMGLRQLPAMLLVMLAFMLNGMSRS